jgi:hypothetical protein
VFGAVWGAVLAVLQQAAGEPLGAGARSLDDLSLLWATAPLLLAVVPATLVCKHLLGERVGLTDARWALRLAQGLGLGALAIALCVVVPALMGATTLSWAGVPAEDLALSGLQQGVIFVLVALGEELALRGVAFRALERGAGPVVATVGTGAVFGLLHLTNPGASPVAAAGVSLVGFWFGALTARTGSLWCALGLHLAWNLCEGFVFGQPVSGIPPGSSLLAATWQEPGFWSGGAFGPEAAGWTAVVLAAGTIATVAWPGRRDRSRPVMEQP